MSIGHIKSYIPPEALFIIDTSGLIKKWNLIIRPNKCFEKKDISTDYIYYIYVNKKLVNIDYRYIVGSTNVSTTDDDYDNNTIISTHYDNSINVEKTADVSSTLYMTDTDVQSIGGNYGYYKYPLTITVAPNYGPIYDLNIEFQQNIIPTAGLDNLYNLNNFKTFHVNIMSA